jgi:molybdenum ABC transporter molybdate-binding protein
MWFSAGLATLVSLSMISPTQADNIHLYAAGSLKDALTAMAKSYEAESGDKVEAKYGPSGLLKDDMLSGANAHVFASANMQHPEALHDLKRSGPVVRFARNKLCALVTPGLAVDGENLLDPNIKIAISTPKADPSGDYAIEVFRKAGLIKPGAQAALEEKALQLVGSASSAKPPAGRTAYGWHVAEGHADIFLTYCTNSVAAQKENPGQQIVTLPATLAVGADYGLTVINGAPLAAQRLADFIMSTQGQMILADHGFATGN